METVIGILAGVLAGIRKGKFIDNLVLVSTLFVISIPIFVIGATLQMFLGVRMGLFPVTVSPEATFYELLLPGVRAGLRLGRLRRPADPHQPGREPARRLRPHRHRQGPDPAPGVGVHTLRNSLIPVVTYIGVDVGALLGGAIVTERIFNIKGVGDFLFRSIGSRDGVAVVGTVTVLVIVYLFANLIVDLLYGVLDPRISHD